MPLSRINGNGTYNLKELIYNSYDSAIKNIPEIKDVKYNTDSKQFEYGDGRPFTDDDSKRIATELSRSVGAYRAGSSTIKRAALFNTFLSATGRERGRQVLDSLVTELHGNGLNPELQGVIYSRAATLQNSKQQQLANAGASTQSSPTY